MSFIDNIITGEKLQQLTNVYIGTSDDFNYNPLIASCPNKHKNIHEITGEYHNPSIIFCYGHRIQLFAEKLQYFKNPFTLLTHNSDQNILKNNSILTILNSPLLQKWYAQNVGFIHAKIGFLPIGMANSMWPHGNLNFFRNSPNITTLFAKKTKKTFMNFNISTNREKRQACHDILSSKIPFLPMIGPYENLKRLSEYEFCICPAGNGFDTHRFWEALYLQCIPIVITNPLIEVIRQTTNIPMVILPSWSDYNNAALNYSDYVYLFNDNYFDEISVQAYRNKITIQN